MKEVHGGSGGASFRRRMVAGGLGIAAEEAMRVSATRANREETRLSIEKVFEAMKSKGSSCEMRCGRSHWDLNIHGQEATDIAPRKQ